METWYGTSCHIKISKYQNVFKLRAARVAFVILMVCDKTNYYLSLQYL
jgi:hypothetical protein